MKRIMFFTATVVLLSQACSASLIAHWKFDEDGGSVAESAINAPTDDGVFDGSFQYYNTNLAPMPDSNNVSHIGFSNAGGVTTPVIGPSGVNARSICLWIKTSETDHSSLVGWGSSISETNNGYLGGRFTFKTNNGVLRAEIGGSSVEGNIGVLDGTWHHVAVTLAQGETKMSKVTFYIDGIKDTISISDDTSDINTQTNANIIVGQMYTGTYRFNGQIDDVRVYDHELDQLEIQLIYDGSSPQPTVYSPTPGDQAVQISQSPTLQWLVAGVSSPAFDINIGTDSNCDDILVNVPTGAAQNYSVTSGLGLELYETYCWRVDVTDGGTEYPGTVWRFTTLSPTVEINADPNSLTVQAGSNITFEVHASNATAYQWKKDDVALADGPQGDGSTVTGAQTALLSVNGVTRDSEGGYMCLLSNPVSSATSTEARLMTKREVAFWQFENNLVDDIDQWQGIYVDANDPQATPTPVYTSAGAPENLQGRALVLQADDLHVQIVGSEEYFNFLDVGMTVIAWMKSSTAPTPVSYLPGRSGWEMGYDDLGYASMDTIESLATATSPNPNVTTQALFDGQWHMVAGTYDPVGNITTIHIDGQLIASESGVDPATDAAGPVVIGAAGIMPDSKPFDGLVDNVSIYSYPLTPTEIAHLYVNVTGTPACSDINAENIVFDFNHNCTVDIADFAVLAQAWGTNDPLYDLVVDGDVNVSDLAVFVGEWLNTAIVK